MSSDNTFNENASSQGINNNENFNFLSFDIESNIYHTNDFSFSSCNDVSQENKSQLEKRKREKTSPNSSDFVNVKTKQIIHSYNKRQKFSQKNNDGDNPKKLKFNNTILGIIQFKDKKSTNYEIFFDKLFACSKKDIISDNDIKVELRLKDGITVNLIKGMKESDGRITCKFTLKCFFDSKPDVVKIDKYFDFYFYDYRTHYRRKKSLDTLITKFFQENNIIVDYSNNITKDRKNLKKMFVKELEERNNFHLIEQLKRSHTSTKLKNIFDEISDKK